MGSPIFSILWLFEGLHFEACVKKVFRNIVLIINIVAATVLLFSYLSVYIPPDTWWAPSLLGLAYPYLLVVNLGFVIFWLLMKPRLALISAGSVLIGWSFLSGYAQLAGKKTEERDIKVLSYNVKHFTGTGKNPSHDLAEMIKSFLKEEEPDIICLQEVKLRTNRIFNLEATKKEFTFIRHYQYARSAGTAGSVTFTRFPIVKMREIRFENSGNIAIYTDVVAGKDTIRVFNVHLQSYQIDPARYKIIDSPGFSEEENIREMREIGSKLRRAMKMRAVQARMIRAEIDQSPYPVIVCGDFNDTPASYTYRKVKGDLQDAFVCSGKGVGHTYLGKLPSFRIDYVLHSPDFKSYNFKTYEVPYSDHLPVSCDLLRK